MRIFVGFDPRESVSYHVACHSIMRRSSKPIDITPVALTSLTDFKREREPLQSTDFAFTRFMVPYLSGYTGWSLWMDSDVLIRTDIVQLESFCNWQDNKSVYVVKHDYTPKDKTKFLGGSQTPYPRKNWSSVMLFNNMRCKSLTPEYVNTATGLELHRFQWLEDSEIGELPIEWNHLVGEYDPNPNAKIAHYTRGGPWFPEYKDCEFSKEWFDEYENMSHPIEVRT